MTAAEWVVSGALTALGHPCCGQGPLRKLGSQLFWHRVLNLPAKFYRWNRHVIQIPLTREQAEALAPEWVVERESWDVEDA